jgi:radical SAM protein with 4Fe4S-binding SPASM domain
MKRYHGLKYWQKKAGGNTMNDSDYPITSGKVVIKKRGEKYVIKDTKTGTQGKANEDLRDLLLLCDGTRTVQEVAEKLSGNFEESFKEVKKKVVKSLEFLEDLHFLQIQETSGYAPLLIRDADLEWPLDLAYLEVTNSCNLRCIHCYKKAGESLNEEMSTQEWVSIIDELKELGVMTLAVTGGEPFMREDIFDILEYAASQCIGVNIFTNGTLITEEVVTALNRINPEKVMVSIDGTREPHEKIRGKNTFDRTVKGIHLLTENGIKVRSNTVIYTENVNDLESVIQLLLDLGVQEMILDRLINTGRGKEFAHLIPPLEIGEVVAKKCKTFEEKAPQRFELKFTGDIVEGETPYSFCGIGTSMVTVKANGDVALCPVLGSPECTAGNVKDTSIRELWEKSEIFQPFRNCNLDDMVCKTCSHSGECRGGCKARAFQYYGKVCMPDPWMCAVRGQKWPDT